jgi:hypothetical protein
MSYIKRVAVKIRSVRGPLIMGLREWAEIAVNWMRLDWIFCLEFLGEFLEKGNARKHTKNRVAR